MNHPDRASDRPLPQILYIMGTGRSGSTVLEILLSRGRGAVGGGELGFFPRDAVQREQPCSCGLAPSKCPQWGPILRDLDWSPGYAADAADAARTVEWHRGFPRTLAGRPPKADWARWVDANDHLLRAIAAHTGATWVIDSTKYAGRAVALSRAFPGSVRVIVLTRGPRGLMQAFSKARVGEQPGKSAASALAYYTAVTASIRAAALRLDPDPLYLTFEDLVADPAATLRSVSEWSGLDLSDVTATVAAGGSVDVGHLITANRLRSGGPIQIRDPGVPEVTGLSRRTATRLMDGWRRVVGL